MLIYIYSIYHLFNCLGKFKEDKMKPFASVKKKKMANITLHTVVIINRDVLPKMSLIVISTGTCIPTLKSPSGPSTKMWYEALCYNVPLGYYYILALVHSCLGFLKTAYKTCDVK